MQWADKQEYVVEVLEEVRREDAGIQCIAEYDGTCTLPID
jgi:hypothetical protein